jgi:3-oxoadipate CoA-transferase alpha subunit
MAAKTAVAQVHRVVELGSMDPEHVITPGIFVKRVVQVERVIYDPTPAKRGEQHQ